MFSCIPNLRVSAVLVKADSSLSGMVLVASSFASRGVPSLGEPMKTYMEAKNHSDEKNQHAEERSRVVGMEGSAGELETRHGDVHCSIDLCA